MREFKTPRSVVRRNRFRGRSWEALRDVRDRPLVLQRFPDGIEEEGFYQKQFGSHFPDWIDTVRVELCATGDDQTLVVCNNKATLVDRTADFDVVRDFAVRAMSLLEARYPDELTTAHRKAEYSSPGTTFAVATFAISFPSEVCRSTFTCEASSDRGGGGLGGSVESSESSSATQPRHATVWEPRDTGSR